MRAEVSLGIRAEVRVISRDNAPRDSVVCNSFRGVERSETPRYFLMTHVVGRVRITY